jgi:hypothetical protein
MPYNITTKDGITLRNIPDDIPSDHPDLKARVQKIRAEQSMPAQLAPLTADPTEGMSDFDELAAGFGKAIVDTGRGLGQMVGAVSRADVDEANKRDAALMDTTAGTVGNVAGNLALVLPTVTIPGAATLRGAALIGGAQGAVQPVGADNSRLQNMAVGTAAGAGGVAAGRAVLGAVQGGRALLEPFSQSGRDKIAGRVIQRFADNPAAVTAARSGTTVTGANPTLAEATSDAGMARLQDAVRSTDPSIAGRIDARLADNNAAQVAALEGLAGNDVTRTAAAAARTKATKDLYQTATNANYTVDATLADLLRRPAVKQAMARAEVLAKNQGRPFSFTTDGVDYLSGLGNNGRGATTQITGQGLQDLKMAMDEMLTDPNSGFTGKAGNTIKDLRGQILSWMESANPDFKAARTGFAAASKPINQMDVAQKILTSGASNTSDLAGNVRLMPNKLTGMLKDEAGLIKSATGRSGLGNTLADVMTPDQENLIRTLIAEVDKTGAVARAGNGPGSATAQRMASQNVLQRMIGPTGLPTSLAESALANTIVGKPLNLVYGGVAEPKIQQALAEAVLDPIKAKAFVQAAQQQGLMLPNNVLTRLAATAARATPSTLAVSGQR